MKHRNTSNNAWRLFWGAFTLLILVLPCSQLRFFAPQLQNQDGISPPESAIPNLATPSPGSPDLDNVSLAYRLEYTLSGDTFESDRLDLVLNISGTDGLYENGTIKYFLSKNIASPEILDALGMVFGEAQISFFESHAPDDYLETQFSFRRENILNQTNFVQNSSYTIFWLNSSDQPKNYVRTYQNIPFFDVSDPFYLTVQENRPVLASPDWSPDEAALAKNVLVTESYYLLLNWNNEVVVKLYYDEDWTLLLRADFDYTNRNDPENYYSISIHLESSSLPIEFLPKNPYWEARIQKIKIYSAIGGGALVLALGTVFMWRYLKRRGSIGKEDHRKKQQNVLDQI